MKKCGNLIQTKIVCFTIYLLFFTTTAYSQNIFESISRSVKAQFTGDSEVVDLGSNTYEITYHSRAAANSAEKHKNWNSLAKKACKGGPYEVLTTRYRSATTIDQIMIGKIKCKVSSSSTSTNSHYYSREVVLTIQKQLSTIGYNVVVDGAMGGQTRLALHDFQEKNSLEATGEPNEKTLKRLQQASENPEILVQNNSEAELEDKSNRQLEKSDVVSKLKELHQLKKDGAITEEEYILLKKKLIQ